MNLLERIKEKPSLAFKILGFVILVLILATFLFQMIRVPFSSFGRGNFLGGMMGVSSQSATVGYAPGAPMIYNEGAAVSDSYGLDYDSGKMLGLSARNIAPSPMPPYGGTVPGDDAENFEVSDYSATIETHNAEKTCGQVFSLKGKSYVIFESSNTFDTGCNVTFKVKRANVEEVLATIKELDPKDLSQNVQTIKSQIEDFTSQTDILKNKLATIDDTLQNAITAYDQITALATRASDVESLAKIIDSKLNMVERLTQERINITSQLEYLGRAKADQLDRLDYTNFYVNVYEVKFVDGEYLADSWRNAIVRFVQDINRALQNSTVGLIALILLAVPYIIFLAIILVAAKYAWVWIRKLWGR